MPFIQRVVSPTFLSRSEYGRASRKVFSKANARSLAEGTSAEGNDIGVCAAITCQATNTSDTHCSKTSDVIEIPGAAAAGEGTKSLNSIKCHRSKCNSLIVNGYELESVVNVTLSNTLRQLASIVVIANDIFYELNKELQQVGGRSNTIRQKIYILNQKVEESDPKLVTVPESDLETFVQIKNHYESNRAIDTEIFSSKTRSRNVQILYEAAGSSPLSYFKDFSEAFEAENIAEEFPSKVREQKTKIDAEIEIRLPDGIESLRKWTSLEALGDITVTPDCTNRVANSRFENDSKLCNTITDTIDAAADFSMQSQSVSIAENDLALDHRLPSPEEQCCIIALKFPAEIITVDISGKRFERMCLARKSIINNTNVPEQESCDDAQAVRHRSKSRRPRGKRRNTIAGIDKKEIEEAAIGNNECEEASFNFSQTENTVKRSKSNDILKKEPNVSGNNEMGKTTMTRLNSLRLWGRQRLKMMNRAADDKKDKKTALDFDDMNNLYETVISKNKKKFFEKEKKTSHVRNPSGSSSDKISMSTTTKLKKKETASINPVKLREFSSLRRQRRDMTRKEEPHSSSGNWSASSESGRASIGSEITIQPKSSASSCSLNQSNAHPSSGPPSSVISRRRFLNTSASSSVTSEDTATPELQLTDVCYDDETSSAYSCDTEGYYTSFHVDSGLKTLKEEDPITPLQSTSALSITNFFVSSSNQTIVNAENEYDLFGCGSTSTTTSSAGTVCTTLMAMEHENNAKTIPDAPERKSSLKILNRNSCNGSSSTLERSYSSSTVESGLENSGTIKRNGRFVQKEVSAVVHEAENNVVESLDSPDSGNNTSSSPLGTNTNESPSHEYPSNSELEYSESSDLEGFDRLERLKQKTEINSSRIPSMCVITPATSDDENSKECNIIRPMLPLPLINNIQIKSYLTNPNKNEEAKRDVNLNIKKSSLHPLNNMLGKLKGVFPHIKKTSYKDDADIDKDIMYDTAGEYVTIADVTNNNNASKLNKGVYYTNDIAQRNLAVVLSGKLDHKTEYVSLNELPCNLRKDRNIVLPLDTRCRGNENIDFSNKDETASSHSRDESECTVVNSSEQQELCKGARVKVDTTGKAIYNSDSLKRQKKSHTTFIPGPHVKEYDSLTNLESYWPTFCKSRGDIVNINNIESDTAGERRTNTNDIPQTKTDELMKAEMYPTDAAKTQQDSPLLLDQEYKLSKRDKSNMEISQDDNNQFDRNKHIYWTLQSKRSPRVKLNSVSDDTNVLLRSKINYFASGSTEILGTPSPPQQRLDPSKKSSDQLLNISPIHPRNIDGFKTSTPDNSRQFDRLSSSSNISSTNTTNVVTSCSDRLGVPKTTLMDFKKLLLAKSSKTSTSGKLSAVEMLKLNKCENNQIKASDACEINILELSRSPKTFASRRMLKQGMFGSPSKSLLAKQRSGWRMNSSRTNVMSTSIPEVNAEDDNLGSLNDLTSTNIHDLVPENPVVDKSLDFSKNIFLQSEENNFMKKEVRCGFKYRQMNREKIKNSECETPIAEEPHNTETSDSSNVITKSITTASALETAL